MALKDTQIFKDLVNENVLPTWPIETHIADDSLIKAGVILMVLIIVTILVIRLTKPTENA